MMPTQQQDVLVQARILVVEDDVDVRRIIVRALEAAGHAVKEAVSRGEDAVAAAERHAIDVAVVDLGLPGMSGVDTIKALKRAMPSVAVLVLTASSHKEAVLDALKAGAAGYVVKGARLAEIAEAVDHTFRGMAPISPLVAGHVVTALREAAPTQPEASVSGRERQVLQLLVQGHSYASIALALGIGLGTVQTHVKRLYRKLDVSSKAEAVAVAHRLGLLPVDTISR